MLRLTQLAGFGVAAGGDRTPNAIDLGNISATATEPNDAVATNAAVAVSGINEAITLRITLTAAMSGTRIVEALVNGAVAATGNAGTTLDVVVNDGQTLAYRFSNTINSVGGGGNTWSGTATVTNVSDGDAVLDTFTYSCTVEDDGGVVVTL